MNPDRKVIFAHFDVNWEQIPQKIVTFPIDQLALFLNIDVTTLIYHLVDSGPITSFTIDHWLNDPNVCQTLSTLARDALQNKSILS